MTTMFRIEDIPSSRGGAEDDDSMLSGERPEALAALMVSVCAEHGFSLDTLLDPNCPINVQAAEIAAARMNDSSLLAKN